MIVSQSVPEVDEKKQVFNMKLTHYDATTLQDESLQIGISIVLTFLPELGPTPTSTFGVCHTLLCVTEIKTVTQAMRLL